jgi:hypothetical protein
MDSNELFHALKLIIGSRKIFYRVISSNQLDKYIDRLAPKVLIVNLDPSWMPGSHWIAICNLLNEYELFDSFGESSKSLGIYFNKLTNKRPIENCSQFQSITASTCGHFCLYFSQNRVAGRSFVEIVENFALS